MSLSTDEEVRLAIAALSVIGTIIDTVRRARDGSVNASDVMTQLQGLSDALAENDRQADTEVGKKFPG